MVGHEGEFVHIVADFVWLILCGRFRVADFVWQILCGRLCVADCVWLILFCVTDLVWQIRWRVRFWKS